MNLFALADTDIWRLPLSADVQAEVRAIFLNQEEAFNASCTSTVPFDGKYKPDEFECLEIATFAPAERMISILRDPLGTESIPVSQEILKRIKAIFTGEVVENQAKVLIQRFDRRQVLSSKGLSLFHGAEVFRKLDGPGITLDYRLCAIALNGSIRFKSFHVMRQIFDVSQYYVEATDVDIDRFVSREHLKADAAALKEVADTFIRRKVALVAESEILREVPAQELALVAREFGIDLVVEKNSDGSRDVLVVPTQREELLAFLRFLDEDYYKSPLSEARYRTNSKRRLE